ncbi:hypothetical protein DL546_007647 [Coniochaeta pulveracea]|uniref:SET domain-containing protein n=1 Tax=Coniochaeta pulveracea TaxID=177199 RepID=A0A420YA83_9PEZI|nr:hypothetical protein DL546_007647 [Coniochaeta pulveracea]
MDSLPPHVIGRFFLIQQYLLGEDSFWCPYIRSLPQPEYMNTWALPTFWPEEDIEYLEGTNADVAIQEIQANVKTEYKQARKILKECDFPGWQDYTRLLYNWAFCIFTSRSFRPSTVFSPRIQEQVGHIVDGRCSLDDFSVLMPVFDIANHALTAKVEWDTATDPSSCTLKTFATYQPGQQVFNNYGNKTNSELLLGYRFIIPETETLHNDYVHVRKRMSDTSEPTTPDSKPKDFLISLRPMRDPSSLVGQTRPHILPAGQQHVLPAFAHVEDGLIQDLVTVIARAHGHADIADALVDTVLGSSTERGQLSALPDSFDIVADVRDTLMGKLVHDYEKIAEVEFEEDEEGRIITENQNQELALAYRLQCEKVLRVVIELLEEGSSVS